MALTNARIEHCMLDLLGHRAATASICPSDVARALVDEQADWRASMPAVRQVAAQLARKQIIVITQGGPGTSTEILNYYAYSTSFQGFQVGYGAALALIVFVVIMALVLALMAALNRTSAKGART